MLIDSLGVVGFIAISSQLATVRSLSSFRSGAGLIHDCGSVRVVRKIVVCITNRLILFNLVHTKRY